MDLDLWADLNLIGHVSYADYLEMSADGSEAIACYKALQNALHRANKSKAPDDAALRFDELCNAKLRGL